MYMKRSEINKALKERMHNVKFVSLDDRHLKKMKAPTSISSRLEIMPSSSNAQALPLKCHVSLLCEDAIDDLLAETNFLILLVCLGSSNALITSHFISLRAQQRGLPSTAIVTLPMHWEGNRINCRARTNLQFIKKNINSVIIYDLNTLLDALPQDTPTSSIFKKADKNILQILQTVISDHRQRK